MKKRYSILLVFALAFNAAAFQTETALLGRWMFDEGSGDIARDVSIHHYNAGIYGAVRVPGMNGGAALRLDGNDYVALPVNLPAPEKGFSVQLWINPAAVKRHGVEYIGGELYRWYIRMTENNRLVFGCFTMAAGDKKQEIAVSSVTELKNGQWYHIGCTFDGKKAALAVNGKIEAEKQGEIGTFSKPADFSPIVIGTCTSEIGTGGFCGEIAELRIHSRVCSEEELMNVYRQFANKPNQAATYNGQEKVKVLLSGTKKFDGKKDFVEVPVDTGKFFDPSNVFAVSGWFKTDKTTEGSFIFAFGGHSFLRFNNAGKLNFAVSVGGWQEIAYSKSLSTGEWHHFFCSYDGIRISMGIDGELDSVLLVPGQVDMNGLRMMIGATPWQTPPTGFFDGEIRDVKVYGSCMDYEQLDRIDPDASLKNLLAQTAKKRQEQLMQARRILEDQRHWVASQLSSPLAEGELPNSLNGFVTSPMSPLPILPDTNLAHYPAIKTKQLYLAAAPGETVPASLVFKTTDTIGGFLLKPSAEFSGAAGKLTGSSMTIKSVKAWHQDGNAGIRIERNFEKKLYPELLLNNDALVVVDERTGDNYLNTGNPEKPLIWISEGRDRKNNTDNMEFRLEDLPVRDATTLQPLKLAANRNKQFFITVKVPEHAQPGTYVGTIEVSGNGKIIGRIPVALLVMDIKLAAPATRYDLNQPFSFSVYYWGALSSYGGTGRVGGLSKNQEQLNVELRDMKDHGITAPILIWGTPDMYNPKSVRLDSMLDIYQKVGFPDKTLYFGDSGCLAVAGNDITKIVKNIKNFRAHVQSKYAVNEVYFYGRDERRGPELLEQRKNWDAAKKEGNAKIIVSGFPGQFEAVGDLLDLCVWFGTPSRVEAAKWHRVGHKIWNYYNPQAGVENADINRRNYGLWLWNENYDGNSPYCYIDIDSMPWNDFGNTYYRRHGFVYPTVNGVVGTIQWEGYRTAVFDVRYATTLRLAIEKTLAGQDTAKKIIAKQAQDYLEKFKPESSATDLDAVRRTMTEFILKLK